MNIQPEELNNMNGIGLTNGDAADFPHQNSTELDTEGYTPTYDEAFPELPVSNAPVTRNPGPAKATSYSGSMQPIRASTITQVYSTFNRYCMKLFHIDFFPEICLVRSQYLMYISDYYYISSSVDFYNHF